MNFYALLNFFPTEFSAVFDPNPVQVGLKGLAPGLSTTFGAVFVNAALSWFKGHNRELLLFSTVIMSKSVSLPPISLISSNTLQPRSAQPSRQSLPTRPNWPSRSVPCGK
jgi:hypothetical protein